MEKNEEQYILPEIKTAENCCLACGTKENMARRRYCSLNCRQRLRHSLNIRTGLLKALNTRYAIFYFTESVIILDVRPYSRDEIYSYFYSRSPDKKPAEDFARMCDRLGNAWWAEQRKSNKRYIATHMVLGQADRNHMNSALHKPQELKKPAGIGKSLCYLQLSRSTLDSGEIFKQIKLAYWQQAKKYHPDQGGDAGTFRRIHRAYEQLINWAENPSYTKRRGFPDKWFYHGFSNKWVQPTPLTQ